jgi:hypothetical protein
MKKILHIINFFEKKLMKSKSCYYNQLLSKYLDEL